MTFARKFPLRLDHSRSLGALAALITSFAACQGAIFTVSNINDSGAGSLRQAILDANQAVGLDTIRFAISGSGVRTITPLSVFPPILDPVLIDGTSQPGYAGAPLIELNGTSAGPNAGLRLFAGDSTVQGLVINRFGADGILIQGPGTNVVRGNYIGTDPTGMIKRPNLQEGVFISDSSGNVVGGSNAGDRNLISGNTDAGVYVLNGAGNIIQGNYIGTTAAGTAGLGNSNNGVILYNAPGNLVGGTSAGARNLISGNSGSGVYLFGTACQANRVQGNYIGTQLSGSLALRNTADGVTTYGAIGNFIGGTNTGAGNLISGNGMAGVSFIGPDANGNLVQGNSIGTTAAGTAALGNTFAGVALLRASGNLIGGDVPAARNLISGNLQDGVLLTTNSTANTVAGNYIGLNQAGTAALANGFSGISFDSANSNLVGGTSVAARNVISGNTFHGLEFFSGSRGNTVQGCYVGTDATGAAAVGNTLSGLRIESPANQVGGASAGAGNVISGNGEDGIYIIGTSSGTNVIQGNRIGTTAAGTGALGNARGGVGIVDSPANVVGGVGVGNLISANRSVGIFVLDSGATANWIQGNRIGTNRDGTAGLGNAFDGIQCGGSNRSLIGGPNPGEGNLISANGNAGVWFQNSSHNVLQANYIGTKADGTSPLGNGLPGVDCDAGSTNNMVGGIGVGNRIAFSPAPYSGVRVRSGSTNAVNNLLSANAIFGNGALGIDLGLAGKTANDACDADAGANRLQNFPVLSSAISSSSTAIRGSLESTSGGSFKLQFFANPSCDSSGNGEGEIFLGEQTVAIGAGTCVASFLAQLPVSVPVGYFITATATDSANNTSEFSACVPVEAPPALNITRSADGQQITLAWPGTASGFVLVEASSLSPDAAWTPVPVAPTQVNGQWVVTLPVSKVGSRFYALSVQ
jgi:titin